MRLPSSVRFAAQTLKRAAQDSIPVDLARVVGLWRGLLVVEENIDGPGFLVDLGSKGGEIVIRRSDSFPRKRFTIGHEIGHWALSRSGFPSRPEDKRHYAQIERWCDSFASHLLIPEEWLAAEFRAAKESNSLPEFIAHGPSRYQVSLEAFCLRVANIQGSPVIVLAEIRNRLDLTHAFLPQESAANSPRTIDLHSAASSFIEQERPYLPTRTTAKKLPLAFIPFRETGKPLNKWVVMVDSSLQR